MSRRHLLRTTLALFLFALTALGATSALTNAAEDPGWLGISLMSAPERPSDETVSSVAPSPQGAAIAGVVEGSPADRAGLRAADLVVRVDGQEVGSPSDVVRMIKSRGAGSWTELVVRRGSEERSIQVRLDSRSDRRRGMDIKRGWVGLTLMPVPQQLREYWGGSEESGVLVGEVAEGSPAAVAGIRPGDLILRFGGEPFADARALTVAIRRGGVGNAVEAEVSRQGSVFGVDLEIEDKPELPARRPR